MWTGKPRAPSKIYERKARLPRALTVAATRGVPEFGKTAMQKCKSTGRVQVYETRVKGIVVGADRGWSVFVEKGRIAVVMLPSIHKILAPLYAMLGIFGVLLVADLPYVTTPSGFYQLIGDFGPFLTVAVATVYLWNVFRKMK